MSNSMKSLIFIISLIAYFIYLTISSPLMAAALNSSNLAYAVLSLYLYYALGILVVLYTQAGIKYWYTGKQLKTATVHYKLPMGKFRLTERLIVYILPALAVVLPMLKSQSFTLVNLSSIAFLLVLTLCIEILFYINIKTMKAYITDKGIVVRGIDLRLEMPIPFTYRNPSGFYPFEKIINFMDLNDKLMVEQAYDMGYITLTADTDTLQQIKGLLLAKDVKQKKF
jgi:hypothetical protein